MLFLKMENAEQLTKGYKIFEQTSEWVKRHFFNICLNSLNALIETLGCITRKAATSQIRAVQASIKNAFTY